MKKTNLRNIAIIAHVDHGKTTLVDSMLKQTGYFEIKNDGQTECVLDSNELERERGITILSKNTSIKYKDNIIHIVDTPGHADFGSEVERVMKMVDGALLLVDAVDGPMPQTRFVLKKALEQKLKIIVVVNKMDKENRKPEEVIDRVFSLFLDLNATDEQLDFPIVYCSARSGWASKNYIENGTNLDPLFDSIIENIPAPNDTDELPLRMLVTMIDYNSYTGRIAIGRIFQGKVKRNETVKVLSPSGKNLDRKVIKIMGYRGLEKIEMEEAYSQQIVALYGIEGIDVGDTISSADEPGVLEGIKIDEPTVSMEFYVNDGPFAQKDGKLVNITQIRDRLLREAQTNVGLKVEEIEGQSGFKVSGRGELHLAILIETMRREGYEFCVSKMKIITHIENGVEVEPQEYLILEAPQEFQGAVMSDMARRGAEMKNMQVLEGNIIRYEYIISERGLIGFKSNYINYTRGNGIMHQSFYGFLPLKNIDIKNRRGVFIAKETGKTAAYALNSLQEHGIMFVGPGEDVYMGQIVGENDHDNDLIVNPIKEKRQTNMRSSTSDESVVLTPPRRMPLEEAIEYIEEDEFVEVTPLNVRMRKKVLDHSTRKRGDKEFI